MISRDEQLVEEMFLNNFAVPEMIALVENIASYPDKNKIKQGIISGEVLQKYRQLKGEISPIEEEIIKSIFLYLTKDDNAKRMLKLLKDRLSFKKTPVYQGTENLLYLKWQKNKKDSFPFKSV